MDIKYTHAIVFVLLMLGLSAQQAFAEIYRWVDENGRTRFSDRPVKGDHVKTIQVDTSKNAYGGGEVLNKQRDLLDRYVQQDLEQKKAKQQAARDKEKQRQQKKNCIQAKDQLATYERSKLYDLDEKGERVYYSAEKRQQAIENFRQVISKNCR